MRTFFAPAFRCCWAPSRVVKMPVDSTTTSTSRSPHGNSAGSRSESIRTSSPAACRTPSASLTSSRKGPRFESYRRRCAIVSASPRSFSATMSMSAPRATWARKKLRPIRPNPLMPTRIAMPASLSAASRGEPQFGSSARGELLEAMKPPVHRRLAGWGARPYPELAKRVRRIAKAKLGGLAERVWKPFEPPLGAQLARRLELQPRGPARPHEIGVIRVRETVRISQRRCGTARSSSARTVSAAPAKARIVSIASHPFAYAAACVSRTARPR